MKTTRQFSNKTFFMFIVCISIFMGVTSCNSDAFEGYGPEPKKMTDAELVEWALAQLPQSRAYGPYPLTMVTTSTYYVNMHITATSNMVINWGDGSTTQIVGDNASRLYTHSYNDNQPAHSIYLTGSNQAIRTLQVGNMELVYLDVNNNNRLERLGCNSNRLNILTLLDCQNLRSVFADNNQLPSIDLTDLPNLEDLSVANNKLTSIDVSKNHNLSALFIGDNQITSLDLRNNPYMEQISIPGLPINTMDFSIFPYLLAVDVSRTPFTSLDLSNNPLMGYIAINYTGITELNISNMQLFDLHASYSELQNINYGMDRRNLERLRAIDLKDTPLESDSQYLGNLFFLLGALPDRNGYEDIVGQGRFILIHHLFKDKLHI